jgi:hypothetical protein
MESFRRGVQNGRETIAKAFDNAVGEGWADAFNLGGEVAFQRGDAGGPNRLEVIDAKLLAIAGVLLEAAGQAESGANLDTAQVADDGNAASCAVVVAAFDHRDRIAVGFVDEEQLVEGAFDLASVRRGSIHGINRFDGVGGAWKWRMRTSMNRLEGRGYEA